MITNNISDLKNKYSGRDVYILANGPSVKENDLSKLKNEIVIGMNGNPVLDEKYNFETDFYLLSDVRFLKNPEKKAIYKRNKSKYRILRSELSSLDEMRDENTYYVRGLDINGFNKDLEVGYNHGATTVMLGIHLAYYIGAKNIYLLGMDLNYSNNGRFYKEAKFQEPDIDLSTQIYNVNFAYKELLNKNIKLYNCSKDSLLCPYIPYMSFEDTFKKDK
jgi:hypothetical protein